MSNEIKINKSTFDSLFPFSFLLDSNLDIVETGKSLKKISHTEIGQSFESAFQIVRPKSAKYNLNSIESFADQIFILKSRGHQSMLLIRGAFYKLQDNLLFLGSPWVTSADDLSKLQLKLTDFALHDPVTDMLQFLKVNEIASNDVRTLNAQLEKSESRYRELVELGSDIIITISPKGYITFTNEIALRILEYERRQLVGQHFSFLIPEPSKPIFKKTFEELLEQQAKEHHVEFQVIKGNGELLWVNQHLKLVYDDNNQLLEVRSFSRDVGKRKAVEQNLKLAEQRLRNLIANLQSGILLESEDRKVVLANQKMCDIFHIPVDPDLLKGADCAEAAEASKELFVKPVEFITTIDRALKNRKIVVGEELHTKDGRILERDFIPIISGERYLGHLWQYHDLTEKKLAEQDLIKARQEAESAREAEQQFITHISHEIRTPLNAIIGMSQLLQETSPDLEQRQYLDILQSSADLLLKLINDVLDVAKIEAGKLEKFETKIDLNKLLKNFQQTFTLQAKSKPIEIQVHCLENQNTFLVSDETLLSQIMFNIVGNAVKFTNQGFIRISAEVIKREDDIVWIKFRVQDSGVGFPEEKLNIIFERFQQANEQISVKYGGTGLGLSISKKLVDFLGGTLSASSEVGKGSTFEWTLPFRDSYEEIQKPKSSIESQKGSQLAGLKILVAEDNAMNLFYVRKVLQKQQAETTFVNTGLEAVNETNKTKFDVILMDIQMPELDGLEATRLIRTKSKINSLTPIIALTASSHKEQVEKATAAGMNDFLSKPFTPDQLIDRVSNLLFSAREIDSLSTDKQQANLEIDQKLLNEFYGDDPEYATLMFKTFQETTLPDIHNLKTAIEHQNFEEGRKMAHKIKPSFTLIGLPGLTEKMQEMEDACATKNPDSLKLFENIQRLLKEILPSVNLAFDILQKK